MAEFRRYPEITEKSSFEEIDQALYLFEKPFYRYCASGAGVNPDTEYPGWSQERERLSNLWVEKCPYLTPQQRAQANKKTPFLEKLRDMFRKLVTD